MPKIETLGLERQVIAFVSYRRRVALTVGAIRIVDMCLWSGNSRLIIQIVTIVSTSEP